MGGEDPNRVLPSVGCEDEILILIHQGTRNAFEARHRANEAPRMDIDNVDRIVRGMRHIQSVATMVDRGMIEAAIDPMRRQLDFADARQPHATVWPLPAGAPGPSAG